MSKIKRVPDRILRLMRIRRDCATKVNDADYEIYRWMNEHGLNADLGSEKDGPHEYILYFLPQYAYEETMDRIFRDDKNDDNSDKEIKDE